jgi:hypothetical protein
MLGNLDASSAWAGLRAGIWAPPMPDIRALRSGQVSDVLDCAGAESRAGEAASFVRLATGAAVGLNVLLPLIEFGRIVLSPQLYGFPSQPMAALLATALSAPLHLRHVVYAVRGQRPPAAGWSTGDPRADHGRVAVA